MCAACQYIDSPATLLGTLLCDLIQQLCNIFFYKVGYAQSRLTPSGRYGFYYMFIIEVVVFYGV